MKVRVVRPGELGPGEVAYWRAFQAAGPPAWRNPFLSPEFTQAVGAVRPTARVAVVEDGGTPVAFFPFEVRGLVVGKAVGAGVNDCQAVVHAPGFDVDAGWLVREARLPMWEFDHLLADQRPFQPYHTAVEGSPIMDLRAGFDAYLRHRLAATSGSVRAALRKRRKLAREVGEPRLVYGASDPRLLATLIRWKSAQYRRTGMADRFQVTWIRRLVHRLAATRTPGCTGLLAALLVDDRPIAINFGLCSETVLVDWFPAYDRDVARYSPGMLLSLGMAEAAAAAGISWIDLGKGRAPFKDALRSGEVPVATGRVVRWRVVAAARRAHLRVRSLLDRPRPGTPAPAAAAGPGGARWTSGD